MKLFKNKYFPPNLFQKELWGISLSRPKIILTIFFTIALVCSEQYLNYKSGYPGLHWDAAYYSSVVINVANDRGWEFDSQALCLVDKPSREYTGHGFLDILLHGKILRARTWNQFLVQLAAVNTITYIVWILTFILSCRLQITRGHVILFCSCAFIISFITTQLQGRPEHLAPLIISPASAVWLIYGGGIGFRVIWAITAGVLFCTSPLLGVLSGLCTIVFLGMELMDQPIVKRGVALACSGAISVIVAIFIVELASPWSFSEWIRGCSTRGTIAPNLTEFLFKFGRYSFIGLSITAPFWNWISLAALGASIALLFRSGNYLFIAVFLLLCAMVIRTATDYGFASMMPIAITLGIRKLLNNNMMLLIKSLFFFLLSLYVLAALLSLHVSYSALYSGYSKQNAMASIGELIDDSDTVAFHGNTRPCWITILPGGSQCISIVPATKGPQPRSDVFFNSLESQLGKPITLFFYPQTFRGTAPERIFFGSVPFRQVYSNWTLERNRLLFLPLIGRRLGFNYAAYRRDTVDYKEIK